MLFGIIFLDLSFLFSIYGIVEIKKITVMMKEYNTKLTELEETLEQLKDIAIEYHETFKPILNIIQNSIVEFRIDEIIE